MVILLGNTKGGLPYGLNVIKKNRKASVCILGKKRIYPVGQVVGFEQEKLPEEDILKMTILVASGHPGGSVSSIDIYLVLYRYVPRLGTVVHEGISGAST